MALVMISLRTEDPVAKKETGPGGCWPYGLHVMGNIAGCGGRREIVDDGARTGFDHELYHGAGCATPGLSPALWWLVGWRWWATVPLAALGRGPVRAAGEEEKGAPLASRNIRVG